jgi:hypothetical protein
MVTHHWDAISPTERILAGLKLTYSTLKYSLSETQGHSGGVVVSNRERTASPETSIILLKISDVLKKEKVVTNFLAKTGKGNGFIVVELNHIYNNKKIVSDISTGWDKTLSLFSKRALEKGIEERHIEMIKDALDDNSDKIIDNFYFDKAGANGNKSELGEAGGYSATARRVATALRIVKDKIVQTFPDDVKVPYIAIRVNDHAETMPIKSQVFEDWMGSTYYEYSKQQSLEQLRSRRKLDHPNLADEQIDDDFWQEQNHLATDVLSSDDMNRIQSILRYESNKNAVRKLNLRVAAFINEADDSTPNPENMQKENEIYYDLCNRDWEVVRITRNGWDIVKHSDKILFKRHAISNAQVYPKRDYPPDILEQFNNLTNLNRDDEDNKVLAEVYLIGIILLANLPKPILNPYGNKGSGKTTYQEMLKQVVDPSAILTTSFPNSLAELAQVISHQYLTIIDNVSEIKELSSDLLCRAVTGGTFQKRGLYTDDEDFIFEMMRAVGFNGINVVATRSDLLDRMLSLRLDLIDKRKRRKLKEIRNEFQRLLPYLLGFIFDKLVEVLNRIGEVKLKELPRMADFAENCELIARCLGYPPMRFVEAYNRNIGFSNEEAINSNLVANVIVNMMETQAAWTGKIGMLRTKLNDFISHRADMQWIVRAKEWPKTDHALRDRLNEVIPNLLEMGIVVDKQEDKHTKTHTYTIVNNHFQSNGDDAIDGQAGGIKD